MSQSAAPVVEGLFEIGPIGPRLIGSRCLGCSARFFPQVLRCPNPACNGAAERELLGPSGVIHSYTIQHYRPPPLFRVEPWAPYAIGLVELGEGLRVMGMLTDIALDSIAIGMPVRLVVRPLLTDATCNPLTTYQFAPEQS